MIKEYISGFIGKRVGFVGVGISNMPIIRLFAAEEISITVRDAKNVAGSEFAEELSMLEVKVISGANYLDGIDEDILFLSPGIKQFLPQFEKARQNGTVITTELQEFFKLCPCKTIGVTGSDGKTTTTTLIAKLLEAQGKKVHLGGNIGKNLFSALDNITYDDYAVVELSSFQLMKMSVSPNIAVITNITPNHLDWHKDMNEYIDAKKNIYRFQKSCDFVVINNSNDITADFAKSIKGKCVTFGYGFADYFINDKGICTKSGLFLADSDILLPGKHNRENYAAAIAATAGIVDRENVIKVATSFGGVEHRIELVRTVDGVKYYNSSIDSSPSRTKAALESFAGKVIVIAGGYDKNIPLAPLGELFKRKAKAAILTGNTALKIKDVLQNCDYDGDIYMVKNLEQAVIKAKSAASNGDIVILSPAAASFDMFKNFEERGRAFKKIVNSL